MKITIIHKSILEDIPPVFSLIINLTDLKHSVELITCGISDRNKNFLKSINVSIKILPYIGRKGKLYSIYEYLMFRKEVYSILKEKNSSEEVLVIEGAHTLFSIGERFSKMGFKYILLLPEYVDKNRRLFNAIGRVIDNANAVLVPEYNRCYFYKIAFKLKKTPVLFPNKPYFEPDLKNYSDFEKKYINEINLFKNKKVILYQGHVSKTRDISTVVKAVSELGADYQLVLMGKDYGVINDYRKIDPKLVHIPFIPAPDYLYLTQMAHIGILMYYPCLFNTAYCAPNKIFEYTKYGLPILGNDIPGIYYPVTLYNCGKSVDFDKPEEIKLAIKSISVDYNVFKKNALKFYESVDNKETISRVLNNL